MAAPERRRMTTLELVTRVTIVAMGALLAFCIIAVYMQMIHIQNDVVKNRQVGCISRYLDHQEYAPQCDRYVNEFRSNR